MKYIKFQNARVSPGARVEVIKGDPPMIVKFGSREFKTKGAALSYFAMLLKSRRLDHAEMLDLFSRHPRHAEKTGGQPVERFIVQANHVMPTTNEFAAVLADGRVVDFSYRKCLGPTRAPLTHAETGKLQRRLTRDDICIVIDTREQRPLEFDFPTVRGTLRTGDYSARGFEREIGIERKSIQDLAGSCGQGRDRFNRCVERLLALPLAAIFVDGLEEEVYAHNYTGNISPQSIMGSVASWRARGLQVCFFKDRWHSAQAMGDMIWHYVKDRDIAGVTCPFEDPECAS